MCPGLLHKQKGYCHKTIGGAAYNFIRMNGNLPEPNEEYMTKCQNTLRQKYGEPVYILITQKADPTNYPNGAWFDAHVNRAMQIAGVDEDNIPQLYILPGGNSVPFSCAELLSWTAPVNREREMVNMVDEIVHKKRLSGRQEVMTLLRLAFPEIPEDAELVISQSSPFLFADGTILWLEEHRYRVDDYMVQFVAGVHEVKAGKFSVVALDNGLGSCISLTKVPANL